MKSTGREAGLIVNSEVDERYHMEKATITCKYLKEAWVIDLVLDPSGGILQHGHGRHTQRRLDGAKKWITTMIYA